MMQVDDSNIKSIQEGITALRKKEDEIRKERANSRSQVYKDKYIGNWIKIVPRNYDTFEPEQDSDEFKIIKVKDIKSVSEVTSFQDSIEFISYEGTYLGIDEGYDGFGKIHELEDWRNETEGYSNCIKIIKPDELNQYLTLLQDKINKIIAAK